MKKRSVSLPTLIWRVTVAALYVLSGIVFYNEVQAAQPATAGLHITSSHSGAPHAPARLACGE